LIGYDHNFTTKTISTNSSGSTNASGSTNSLPAKIVHHKYNDFAALTGDPSSDGNYYILTAGLTREQPVFHGWGLRLHADGQWANQPLISNEQFALGGAPGVRGYHDGEQYGDNGWRVQFEPHSPYLNFALVDGTTPLRMRFHSFVDYGQSYLLAEGAKPNSVSLFGVGFGFSASVSEHLDMRLQLGVPLLDTRTTRSGTLRVTFGLGAQF
jgi:hemolysin activation/secretion protein